MTGATADVGKACRLCGAHDPPRVFHLERAPASVEHLLSEGELAKDSPRPLDVHACEDCGFVQLCEYLGDTFYSDYEMGVGFSKAFQQYLENLADDFYVASGLPVGARLLEVGCGDGSFLTAMQSRGLVVTGVEPSRSFRETARQRGHTVYEHLVGRDSPAPGGPYDAFVARQVVEHVFDLNGFLNGIHSSLKSGARFLIEVPRLETALESGRFYDFFPDHVNYFSAATLRRACEGAGFEVLAVKSTMNGEFVTAFGRKSRACSAESGDRFSEVAVAFGNVAKDMETLVRSFRSLANEHRASSKTLGVWGAGGKGIVTLAAANIDSLDCVVDSDPRKQGRFMPTSHYKVESVDRLAYEPPDTLVLTALAHRQEILTQLRDDLAYRGTVMTLGRSLERIDLKCV